MRELLALLALLFHNCGRRSGECIWLRPWGKSNGKEKKDVTRERRQGKEMKGWYEPPSDPRHHMSCAHRLDQKDVRHDREDVVMARKRREPMDGEVVYPNDQDGDVYREDPKHENEQRVGIVVEVPVGSRALRETHQHQYIIQEMEGREKTELKEHRGVRCARNIPFPGPAGVRARRLRAVQCRVPYMRTGTE